MITSGTIQSYHASVKIFILKYYTIFAFNIPELNQFICSIHTLELALRGSNCHFLDRNSTEKFFLSFFSHMERTSLRSMRLLRALMGEGEVILEQ